MRGLSTRLRLAPFGSLSFLLLFLAAIAWAPSLLAAPLPQDDTCLACHGQEGMTDESGKSIYVNVAKQKASVHGALPCTTCHSSISEYPHPKPAPKVQCSTCHAEAVKAVSSSIHGRILGADACLSCHGEPHNIALPAQTPGATCHSCHADAVREFQQSIHATVRTNGDKDAPICQTCHGPAHKLVESSDPASPVAKKNLPTTCATCHANPNFLARHQIPFARPVEAFRNSIHGREVEAGNPNAPSCSNCHTSHFILPARDPRSSINHFRVPETCGACHTIIKNTYLTSVHGKAVLAGSQGSPVCSDCHGEHNILAPSEPGSLVNPARVSTVTCGHCHSDARLASRFNLPLDRVPSFEDSFHGLAARSGSQTVANCASCHGVHNILPSSDPASTVNSANLAATCGQCHPGAGERFALGPVHVLASSATAHPTVRWIRWAYVFLLIPFTVGFMLLHNLLDWIAKVVRGTPRHDSGEQIERMNRQFRFSHWLIVISFPTLVATGFALKYPESWWAAPIVQWEGRYAIRGLIHRIAAVVLLAAIAHHGIHLILRKRDRIILPNLIPRFQDLQDMIGVFAYNLGLRKDRPTFGMFSYAEKIEYWAFMWGTVVMALSGFILWFNNFSLRYFPKWVSDAATAIHFYEAILASLAILIWHFYMTVFDPDVYPMDRVWVTGKASADHLKHTRPAYYLDRLRRLRSEAAQPAAAPAHPAVPEAPSEKDVGDQSPARTQQSGSAGPQKPQKPPQKPSE